MGLLAAIPLGLSQEEKSKVAPRVTDEQFGRLIDALANSNPQPKITELGSYWAPSFADDFAWKEQDKVVEAIGRLLKHVTPATWEQLVTNSEDQRYCITFNDQAANADEFAKNWSVGDLCHEIASFHLEFPVEEAIDVIQAGERPIFLPIDGISDLKAWRRKHCQKPLYELQIELCRLALADLPRVKDSSRDFVDDAESMMRCRKNLEDAVQRLQKRKSPEFGNFKFPSERFELYNAVKARESRLRVQDAIQRELGREDDDE